MKFKKAVLLNITEAMLDKDYWQKLDEFVENKVLVNIDDPNLNKELADADCLLIIWGTKVDKATIDSAPNLKYIGALATAYGGVDLEYAKSKGIVVTNIPGYATESVAEFVIAALLEHIRGLSKGLQAAAKDDFTGAGITARELKNSKFGVIGLGEIGNRVAELASGFGAQVSYYNRSEKAVPFEKKDLSALAKESEIISLNLAHTSETAGIISKEILGSMSNNCVFVSTAPPDLIDIDALVNKLQSSKDFYFISDQGDELNEVQRKKMLAIGNCILYPSIAYISAEARINKQNIFINNIKTVLAGKPENQVN